MLKQLANLIQQLLQSKIKRLLWKRKLKKTLKVEKQTRPAIQNSLALKRIREMPQAEFNAYVRESFYDYQANKHLKK